MVQQLDLNLETPEKERHALEAKYKEVVGVDPLARVFSPETLRAGIADPEKERLRLKKIDEESDKEELKSPYRPR